MVNNWENGWIINGELPALSESEGKIENGKLENNSQFSTLNSQLVIVFLPQYLEYLGFLLSIGILIYIVFRYIFRSKNDLTRSSSSDKLQKSENLPHINQ